mmetsp:Transcript_2371/g.3728  ORF Transcript_2371/g.3728 Transcript_2371/m.3728 type:complete len:557 (-) Transcript_2371:102-1772(-)
MKSSSNLSKKDLAIAKRALQARQVKNEHKFIKSVLLQRSGSTASLAVTASTDRLNVPSSPTTGGTSNFSMSRGAATRSDTALIPEMRQSSVNSPSQSTLFGNPSAHTNTTTTTKEAPPVLSEYNSQMVTELAQRATTAVTVRRKMQSNVAKRVTQTQTGSSVSSELDATIGATTPQQPPEINDNYFMPKKEIVRSDGASLSDVYASKKADYWGKILKAQLAEEERGKRQKKKDKEIADANYGRLLKKQLADNHARTQASNNADTVFAALEDATAKRTEDMQRKRTEDAINRHKQFISNAVEDMEVKRKQKEKNMMDDLLASTIMINNAKKAIADEEQRKVDEKDYHRAYQERLFQENLDNIERKARLKAKSHDEDRRIIEENERQYQREMARREQDLKNKMTRTSEGPAHHIVSAIVKSRAQKEAEFYNNLFRTENGLNKQLKASEDANAARMKSNGQSLEDEWVKNTEFKARKKQEEEDRNNKILATMRQMLADQEQEDIAKRQADVAAHKKYQMDLDEQLRELRTRSFNSLAKTMSVEEMKYNSDLLKKTSVEF